MGSASSFRQDILGPKTSFLALQMTVERNDVAGMTDDVPGGWHEGVGASGMHGSFALGDVWHTQFFEVLSSTPNLAMLYDAGVFHSV